MKTKGRRQSTNVIDKRKTGSYEQGFGRWGGINQDYDTWASTPYYGERQGEITQGQHVELKPMVKKAVAPPEEDLFSKYKRATTSPVAKRKKPFER